MLVCACVCSVTAFDGPLSSELEERVISELLRTCSELIEAWKPLNADTSTTVPGITALQGKFCQFLRNPTCFILHLHCVLFTEHAVYVELANMYRESRRNTLLEAVDVLRSKYRGK